MDDGAAQRRLARAAWPFRRSALDEDEPAVPGTPAERIAMVETLTQDAWAMSGRAMPDYSRRAAPGLLRKAPR